MTSLGVVPAVVELKLLMESLRPCNDGLPLYCSAQLLSKCVTDMRIFVHILVCRYM